MINKQLRTERRARLMNKIQGRIFAATQDSMDLTYAVAVALGADPKEVARALKDNNVLAEFSQEMVKEIKELDSMCDGCRPTVKVAKATKVAKAKVAKKVVKKTKATKKKS